MKRKKVQLDFIMVSDFFPPTADIIQYCKKILITTQLYGLTAGQVVLRVVISCTLL